MNISILNMTNVTPSTDPVYYRPVEQNLQTNVSTFGYIPNFPTSRTSNCANYSENNRRKLYDIYMGEKTLKHTCTVSTFLRHGFPWRRCVFSAAARQRCVNTALGIYNNASVTFHCVPLLFRIHWSFAVVFSHIRSVGDAIWSMSEVEDHCLFRLSQISSPNRLTRNSNTVPASW